MMMQSGCGVTPVMNTLMRENTTLAPVQCVRTTKQKERAMNKEYLQAKADLCLDQAKIDLEQEEIARAIANLKRANSALAQLFGFEEDESE
jgi:ferredoxin-NADP reductase